MAIDEFELFHGVVLTKLVRSDRPITLRMIETRPGEAWSAYTLNDAVDLFIKHSTNARATRRGRSWYFVFGINQLNQMANSRRDIYVALVGGGRTVADSRRGCVCLLQPDEIKDLLDLPSTAQQALTVNFIPGRQLRVYKARRERFHIPQNRLDQWGVPAS